MSEDMGKYEGMRNKYRYACMMYNYVCSTGRYMWFDGLYHPDDIYEKEDVLLSSRWSVVDCKVLDTDNGMVEVRSMEDACRVRLHKNNQIVEIEYDRLLPSNNVVDKSKKSGKTVKYRIDSDMIGGRKNSNDDSIVYTYRYVRQKHKYHISRYPKKYSYPVYILLQERLRRSHDDNIQKMVERLYDSKYREIVGRLQVYNEISDESDKYLRRVYDTTYMSSYMIMNINSTDVYEADKLSTHRWVNDDRNPSTDILLLSSYVLYYYTSSYEAYYYDTHMYIVSLLYDVCISSSSIDNILHMYSDDHTDMYTINTSCVPICIRYNGHEIYMRDVLSKYMRCKNINTTNASLYTDIYDTYSDRDRTKKKKEEERGVEDGYDVLDVSNSGICVCEAYKNKTIKLRFHDRTILTYDSRCDKCDIISKYGEQHKILLSNPGAFIQYIQHAVDYYDHIFGDPREKDRRYSEYMSIKHIVDKHIEHTNNINSIIYR